jgi:hypothetical protein
MPYTPLHDSLYDHPKLEDLEECLGLEKHEAIGHLVCLWLWAMRHAPDGELTKFKPTVIARKTGYKGDALAFLEALIDAGWITRTPEGQLFIHGWDEYYGGYLRKKEGWRKYSKDYRDRKAAERDGSSLDEAEPHHARVMHDDTMRHAHVFTRQGGVMPQDQSREDQTNVTDHKDSRATALGPRLFEGHEGANARRARRRERPEKKADDFPPIVDDLVTLLADKVEGHSGHAPRMKPGEWWVEMDRLIRIDGASAQEVQETIIWVFKNDFWPRAIINAGKLRKKYEQLRAQMAAEAKGTTGKVVAHPAAAGAIAHGPAGSNGKALTRLTQEDKDAERERARQMAAQLGILQGGAQ